MILKYVHLFNFKKYRKASITLNESMIGIFGNNGAGKSSLFEAVTWCLYGIAQSMEGKEGVKQQDLIRDGEDEMGVEVEFLLGNHTYKVARYLNAKRGTKSRLWIDGKIQAVKSREVISRVEQDMGLNAKGFISSSFIRQKELDLITSQIASERKKLINRLFNLRVYEKFEEMARNKKKEKENELQIVQLQIKEKGKELEHLPELESALQDLEKVVSQLQREYDAVKNESETVKNEYETLEKEYEKYQSLQSKIKVMEKEIENTENGLKERKRDLKEIEEASSRKELLKPDYDRFLDLKENLSSMDRLKLDYDKKTNQLQQLQTEITLTVKNLKERITECKEEVKNLEKEEETLKESRVILRDIREKISILENVPLLKEEEIQKLDKIREKDAEVMAERAKYESRISDLKDELKEIQSIGIGAPCPKCKRPLKKEHLDELVAKYETDTAVHEKALEKCDFRQKHLTEMKNELDSNLMKLKKEENDLNNLKKEEQKYIKSEMRIEEIQKRKEDAVAKIRESERKRELIGEKEKDVERLKVEIKTLEFDPFEYEKVREEVKKKGEIEREMIKLDERISKKESVMISIKKTEEVLLNQKAEYSNLKSDFEDMSEIPEKFSDIKKKRHSIVEKELEISREYTEKKTQHHERIKEVERLHSVEKDLKTMRRTQKILEDIIVVFAVLQDAFKKIPIQIQSRLRPKIRKETSELLNEVTEGKYPFIDLGEDYSVTVYYEGNYYPISRFSGGEKDLINLCLRVGISRVLVSLSSQKSFARVQSLFLDECFGSFDIERRKNLLAALNQLRKYFAQIVLITHIEEIKEALPEAFLVEELEDGSSLVKKVKEQQN
ncbi:MAG: SMC family ATPase [Theionarchaea archaeon]|nr:SMC family ATPase [Theionarchaea archaeon]